MDNKKGVFSSEPLSDEEIEKLLSEIPEISPERAEEMRQIEQKVQESHDRMLFEDYPKLNVFKRRQMWNFFLQHQEMSKENYEKWKSVEPEINLMIDSYVGFHSIKEEDYLRMGRTDYHEVILDIDDPCYAHFFVNPDDKKWWEFWK